MKDETNFKQPMSLESSFFCVGNFITKETGTVTKGEFFLLCDQNVILLVA